MLASKNIPVNLIFKLIVLIGLSAGACIFYLNIKNNLNNLSGNAKCKNCNLVIIDIDVLRADALPCYKNNVYRYPSNICAFAEKGLRFENNFAQAPWTLPSMFSTLTSLYPLAHGVQQLYRDTLPNEAITFPQIFKDNGYKTIWIGGENPATVTKGNGGLKGFNKIEDHLLSISSWPSILKKYESDNSHKLFYFYSDHPHIPYLFDQTVKEINGIKKPDGVITSRKEFEEKLTEYVYRNYEIVFSDEFIESNPELFSAKNIQSQKNKIFKYFHEFSNSNIGDVSKLLKLKDRWKPGENVFLEPIIKAITPEEKKLAIDYVKLLYFKKVQEADDAIGEFLSTLSSPQYSSNTIVVIMSDHGEEFMEHNGMGHENKPYSELLHVPLIIIGPNLKPDNINLISENIDIFPTLLDLTGINISHHIQGRSLLKVINEKTENKTIAMLNNNISSIQDKKWKLIANFKYDPRILEIYDLENDPKERNNLIGKDPIANNYIANLLGELSKVVRETNEYHDKFTSPTVVDPIPPEKRKKMMIEGYF